MISRTSFKASIAGAIVTSSLFMLGASLFLGGLGISVQEYNRAGGRPFRAAADGHDRLLSPSAVAGLWLSRPRGDQYRGSLSYQPWRVPAYDSLGLSLLFSLKDAQGAVCKQRPWRRAGGSILCRLRSPFRYFKESITVLSSTRATRSS